MDRFICLSIFVIGCVSAQFHAGMLEDSFLHGGSAYNRRFGVAGGESPFCAMCGAAGPLGPRPQMPYGAPFSPLTSSFLPQNTQGRFPSQQAPPSYYGIGNPGYQEGSQPFFYGSPLQAQSRDFLPTPQFPQQRPQFQPQRIPYPVMPQAQFQAVPQQRLSQIPQQQFTSEPQRTVISQQQPNQQLPAVPAPATPEKLPITPATQRIRPVTTAAPPMIEPLQQPQQPQPRPQILQQFNFLPNQQLPAEPIKITTTTPAPRPPAPQMAAYSPIYVVPYPMYFAQQPSPYLAQQQPIAAQQQVVAPTTQAPPPAEREINHALEFGMAQAAAPEQPRQAEQQRIPSRPILQQFNFLPVQQGQQLPLQAPPTQPAGVQPAFLQPQTSYIADQSQPAVTQIESQPSLVQSQQEQSQDEDPSYMLRVLFQQRGDLEPQEEEADTLTDEYQG